MHPSYNRAVAFTTALSLNDRFLTRRRRSWARARSRRKVEEAGDGAAELRRGSCSSGVYDDDKVRLRRNGEGVGSAPNRCSQAHHSAIAKVVQAEIRRVIAVQISSDLNITKSGDTC